MSLDKFIQDGQDLKVIEKVYSKINDMLMQNETISYIALQKKPAVTLLPDSITITNRRIFLCEFTKLGLSTNFEIFSWKDIKDIAFKEEIFGSKVTVIPFTGENLSIDYIPKTQARKLYQLIKDALENSKEIESVDEKVFVKQEVSIPKPIVPTREIYQSPKQEEQPVVENNSQVIEPVYNAPSQQKDHAEIYSKPETDVSTMSFTPPAPPPTPIVEEKEEDDELTLKLKKLKSLYDKQLITQSEYESKKAEILSQL